MKAMLLQVRDQPSWINRQTVSRLTGHTGKSTAPKTCPTGMKPRKQSGKEGEDPMINTSRKVEQLVWSVITQKSRPLHVVSTRVDLT